MKKKPTSRKPHSARSGTGTAKQKSGSRRQTATASSRSSRPATISLEGTLEMMDEQMPQTFPEAPKPFNYYGAGMQEAEAAYMNDVTQKIRESASSSTPLSSYQPPGSETGWITSAAATLQKAPYDPTGALENLERARSRLLDARSGHRVALVDYRALRPTDPKFPDAAQVLYAAGLELVKAAGDLYHTVKEI